MRPALAVLFALTFALSLESAAEGDFISPVTVTPTDPALGDIFNVGIRTIEDLPQPYVEEEFLISGVATVYNYEDPPVREVVVPRDVDQPYTTRMIVRRPASPEQFNGTVVIEWWNSTAGFDTAPSWDASAEFFAREGWVYVGFTNSTTSLGFLTNGCRLLGLLLIANCQTRYAGVGMVENGQAYDIGTQIAELLKRWDPENNPLPKEYFAQRVFHVGQSQQGGSMVTYATGFHSDVNDGYFIQAAGSARPINFGPACGAEGSPPYPDCTPRLQGDQRRVRTDLPVPVYRAQTETDMAGVLGGGTRQGDSATFRYYEMAGTAHTTVHKDVEVIPGLLLESFCAFPFNTLADGPVFGSYLYNAMWFNMEKTVRTGRVAPHGQLLETDADELARDDFGNSLGGIRLPAMDVPIATYGPRNVVDPNLNPILASLGGLFCFLSGTTTPFDQATLDTLYPNHGGYVSQVANAAEALQTEGFLLNEDAEILNTRAVNSHIGIQCGIGFELAAIVPLLQWVRRRRKGMRRG